MNRPVVLRVVAAVVAVLALAAAGVRIGGPGGSGDASVIGYFTDVGPLSEGADVRAAGVKVGRVSDISLENGRARVALDVDPGVMPLHQDAQLTIRPVSLLGEYYVDLDAGSPQQDFMTEPEVPVEHTAVAVGLQDVINTFDNPTSTGLASLLTTLGEGMHDNGAKAAAAIKALAPAMRRTDDLAGVLREQNAVLNELVEQVQPVARGLAASDGKALDRLVGSTDRTLSTLAANHAALNATLAELPGTVTEARRALRELDGAASAATPTLKSIRPVTDNLTAITGELQRFADAADPALASLTPVLHRADVLLDRAAPAVALLRKAGPDLATTAENLRPVGDQLLDKHLGDLMAFVKKWSLSTNGRDALGHYFRGVAYVTPETLADLASAIAPANNAGLPEKLADPTQALQDPAKVLPDVLSGVAGGSDPGNATGLSPEQEQSMLNQLLGGD